jgi:hypothetical protein
MSYQDVLDQVSREADNQGDTKGLIKLTSGVVVRTRPVPILVIQKVSARFKLPEPPVVYLEEKGRNEPNPNDPRYLAECERITTEQRLAIVDAMIMLGTEVVSVPGELFKPESDEWIEIVEYLTGETIPRDNKRLRQLYWLKYYAIQGADDLIALERAIVKEMGVPETMVSEALSSFRDQP